MYNLQYLKKERNQCMDDKPDMENEPVVRYKKYFHDLPKEYCCNSMQDGVEELEFIQYYERFDEYTFSSYDGYALSRLRYCPYCGKEIQSLRALYSNQKAEYREERGWKLEDVERYWGLFREGKSQAEAEGIVEQERRSLPVQE
jgi:hypothetical protein